MGSVTCPSAGLFPGKCHTPFVQELDRTTTMVLGRKIPTVHSDFTLGEVHIVLHSATFTLGEILTHYSKLSQAPGLPPALCKPLNRKHETLLF